MSKLPALTLTDTKLDRIAKAKGLVAVFLSGDGKMDKAAAKVDTLTSGALKRFADSARFSKMKDGDATTLSFPAGLVAETLLVIRLERKATGDAARSAGAKIGAALGKDGALVLAGMLKGAADVALGAMLRAYSFDDHFVDKATGKVNGKITAMVPPETKREATTIKALAEGVWFTRDLVNEPANVLTTTEFAKRLVEMKKLGLKVTVLEEKQLEKLGMRTLLSVGQGSESPSKVVVMEWAGGAKKDAPVALVGKGVVFDTGGISLKPAGGMEDMTMDMGGAGVVSGVMKTIAMRKAKANVVGIVGLVENMPDGKATRPGDVVVSMKGDTVEVINTDAEGRLVLCDAMWYAQEKFKPAAMVDLATLTGAVIIALGHENAGVFSNDDALASAFLKAAGAEGEGAWRLPLGAGYDKQINSRLADMKNTGGRPAGSITAAQFLARFVKDETPWMHLDIAGVASLKSASKLAPKGATGWGVLALNRWIADGYEK